MTVEGGCLRMIFNTCIRKVNLMNSEKRVENKEPSSVEGAYFLFTMPPNSFKVGQLHLSETKFVSP
jgi:hypothetical protein